MYSEYCCEFNIKRISRNNKCQIPGDILLIHMLWGEGGSLGNGVVDVSNIASNIDSCSESLVCAETM